MADKSSEIIHISDQYLEPGSIKPLQIIPPIEELDLKNTKGPERYTVFLSKHKLGGMGIIYKAFDNKLGIDVAVKIIRPETVEDFKTKYNKILAVEGATLAKIPRHPNIVEVYDLLRTEFPGIQGKANLLILEWLDPERYKTLLSLKGDKDLNLDLIKRVAGGVSKAIDFAAKNGVLHMELKPNNILVSPDNVKVIDFGMASPVQRLFKSKFGIMGTPGYYSPEYLHGIEPHGVAGEIFVLATTLYDTIAGENPYYDRNLTTFDLNIISKPYPELALNPKLKHLDNKLLKSIDSVLKVAQEKDPSARYQSGKEFADALGAAITPFLTKDHSG